MEHDLSQGPAPAPGLIQQLRQNRMVRNLATALGGSAGAQLINLALIPVIMRIYGPEAFGVVGTFLSLTIILIPACSLTWSMAIVLPQTHRDASGLAKLATVVALLVSILVAGVLLWWGPMLAERWNLSLLTPYLMLLPLVMFSSAVLEVLQQWLYRHGRYRLTARAATSHALVYNGMRSVGGLFNNSATMLVVTSALYYVVHSLLILIGMAMSKPAPAEVAETDEAPRKTLRQLASEYRDFPLFRAPQVLINALSVHMPTLVLASLFGAIPAGYFALCLQVLAMPSNFIGKAMGSVFYPRIAAAVHAREAVVGLLLKGVGAMTAIGSAGFLILVIAGPWLFTVAFGAQWHEAGEYARWLALAELARFAAMPCEVAIPALRLQAYFLGFEVFATSLRFGAVALGALWGGSALAVVMAIAAANIFIYLAMLSIVVFKARAWQNRQRGTLQEAEA
ncbi:oligosaccharide flippase family protein [Pseudomonas sp. CFBP 8770]|uniref:lipopolysaccharide biosynthesis protein n=1 Tax=unclassified Pseudomonas TaxID=196821 RepID=UPI00177C2ECD|nr:MULTISPECIES: oligosaccharide flippase family protein [unclassified Pseudomonas]MBD8472839.1 oligosaccharide flippase family protein [Pseudomonas sp. CFBP 8773]MBD8646058.1 oligosaccharide flippase family protein [Pseudomonas sp. CFBP 8770]